MHNLHQDLSLHWGCPSGQLLALKELIKENKRKINNVLAIEQSQFNSCTETLKRILSSGGLFSVESIPGRAAATRLNN